MPIAIALRNAFSLTSTDCRRPRGKPEENRRAGDRAEQEDLSRAHVRRTLHRPCKARHTSAASRLDAMARTQGHSVDEYLETIYFLAFPIGEYRPATGSTAIASRVAEMLGVSRASAGEMLKRLEAEGLVERGEQKEAILTPEGAERRKRVVRKHRIIERFLTDFMGYTAAESHVHADELGDTFTDEMIERINDRLGGPDRCPHGWPVDTGVRAGRERRARRARGARGRSRREDRPARRARRRPAALVLRRGARPRDRGRGGLDAARRGSAHDRRWTGAERPITERAADGIYVRAAPL